MTSITKPVVREIVDDFAKNICERRTKSVKPSKTIINFRTDFKDRKERIVWSVPIDLLRYRKDNGRIASDVLDYQTNIGILDENDKNDQETIAEFLKKKDPEKTLILQKSIQHAGQQEPAIVTCDGFLINGNRRKMVMESLNQKYPENNNFAFMKVVILPNKGEEGGPPTLLEIEKIENRYQLQKDGKSEYYGFDRALSIKRKILLGLTLEEQLRDDPSFSGLTPSELKKKIKEYEREYLDPLKCVDRYLKQFKRQGQYRTISSGMSDPEGRWQAFKDYSYVYSRYFNNSKNRNKLGIEEDEIGGIEESAFDIIRLRTIPSVPLKIHMIMRNIPKYCGTKEGKREIHKIANNVEPVLPPDQCKDAQGNPLESTDVDTKWVIENKNEISYHLHKAHNIKTAKEERETPITLLEAALKKLTHENMDLSCIAVGDYEKARMLAAEIQGRANEIEKKIYQFKKKFKQLRKNDNS